MAASHGFKSGETERCEGLGPQVKMPQNAREDRQLTEAGLDDIMRMDAINEKPRGSIPSKQVPVGKWNHRKKLLEEGSRCAGSSGYCAAEMERWVIWLATGRPVLCTFDLPKRKARQGTQCESEEL